MTLLTQYWRNSPFDFTSLTKRECKRILWYKKTESPVRGKASQMVVKSYQKIKNRQFVDATKWNPWTYGQKRKAPWEDRGCGWRRGGAPRGCASSATGPRERWARNSGVCPHTRPAGCSPWTWECSETFSSSGGVFLAIGRDETKKSNVSFGSFFSPQVWICKHSFQ